MKPVRFRVRFRTLSLLRPGDDINIQYSLWSNPTGYFLHFFDDINYKPTNFILLQISLSISHFDPH